MTDFQAACVVLILVIGMVLGYIIGYRNGKAAGLEEGLNAFYLDQGPNTGNLFKKDQEDTDRE
jgi:hypothetical protein